MRINGEAKAIRLGPADDLLEIRQGEQWRGFKILRMLVGIEGNICMIRLVGEREEQQLSFQGTCCAVEWMTPPNIQSGTEWLLWLAEVVGHGQNMAAIGLEPEMRKFYPKDQMPKPGFAPAEALRPQRPGLPTPAPTLRVVERPAGMSSRDKPADDDAGGPAGFDPDGTPADGLPEPAEDGSPDSGQ